jgi:Helicase conserved C-terminal domain/WYL domain
MTARSLADALRAADDDELARLLQARPELLTPVPVDLGQLAARASSAPVVTRALDRLDRFTLQVLEAVCVPADPVTTADVQGLCAQAGAADVAAAVESLRELALLWEEGRALHVVAGVREVVGPQPAGLGPPMRTLLGAVGPSRLQDLLDDLGLPPTADPESGAEAVAAAHADSGRLAALLSPAPAAARELLDRLTWGPPVGTVDRADRDVRVDAASTPVDWLLSRALLVATGPSTVVLPREVALALRGGRAFSGMDSNPPQPVPATTPGMAHADRTGAAQAFGFVRLVEDLLDTWGLEPASALRAGGVGVRELRRAAGLLDVTEWEAAVVAEVAYAAGLVGTAGAIDDEWLPTPAYDLWRADAPEVRWVALAEAWLRTTRSPGLVGSRDERDRTGAALGPDLDRALAPEVRLGVLGVLRDAAPGTAPDAAAIEDALAWHRPRRPARLRTRLVAWALREAERIGVTGAGALTGPGRALVDGALGAGGSTEAAGDTAAELMAALLPSPVDHVLLQADLTAVAPGPLVADLAHALALAADIESTGGATVYRFTQSSVRRALDAGRSADDLHGMLARHSRTPVPQPLTYLVDDVARRHGRLRVGAVSAYLRCDDPATLDELVADRRSAELRLRRLAPTVVVAQAPVDMVLSRLREMGLAPAAETADGAVLVRRPDSRRAPARSRPPRLVADAPRAGTALVEAAVRALRAGDRASAAGQARRDAVPAPAGQLPRTAAAQTLVMLRAAVESTRPVWIGYVDTHGGVTERVVEPVRLDGGYLTAYDHRSEQVRTFAVHRITGVAGLEPDGW